MIDTYRTTACANRSNFVVLEIIKKYCYEHRQNGIYRMDGTYYGTLRHNERIRLQHQERTPKYRWRRVTGQSGYPTNAQNKPPFPATLSFHGQVAVLHHKRKAVLQIIGRAPVHKGKF